VDNKNRYLSDRKENIKVKLARYASVDTSDNPIPASLQNLYFSDKMSLSDSAISARC